MGKSSNKRQGYVTFADILGWKGIWKEREMSQVVNNLLSIRDACTDEIDSLQGQHLLELVENQLSEFYNDDERKKAKEIGRNKGDSTEIIKIGRKEELYYNEIQELDWEIRRLDRRKIYNQDRLKKFIERKVRIEKELNDIERGKWNGSNAGFNHELRHEKEVIDNIIEELKTEEPRIDSTIHEILMKIDELEKKKESIPTEFDKQYECTKIVISVVLISDTFVISSYTNQKNKHNEFSMHMQVVKYLIGQCLKRKLLVRGATSYGEYFHQGMVFVGSAIDDAASWHELGEEIGVYMTPKGYLSSKHLVDDKFIRKDLLIEDKPILKRKEFMHDTYLVNWGEYYDMFSSVVDDYKTILPEISSKIMNSFNRGKKLKEL